MANESKKDKKKGKIKKKCRRFCTGISVIRLRLGRSQKKPINPANQIGAIFIPSKWKGTVILSAKKTTSKEQLKVRLYYKDGKINNPLTSQEIKDGRNALGNWKILFRYNKPEGQMGWYFVEVSGTTKAIIWNTFFENSSLSRIPWNTWYWPGADNKNPNLYDFRVSYKGPFGIEDDGPLVKYDKFTNQTTPSTSARKCEWEEMGQSIPPGSVGGHCDATAWAAFEEDRPSGSKILTNSGGVSITFREQDRIGLCTLRYWIGIPGLDAPNPQLNDDNTTYVDFIRAGNTFLKADWFHNILHERIANNIGGIQIHDSRNWNYGIFKYRSIFIGLGTSDQEVRKVEITTRMTYIDWGTLSSSTVRKWHGGPAREISTIYRLKYKSDGTIDGQLGIWNRDSLKKGTSRGKVIQFVFWRKKSAPLINSKVDKTILESIYK